MSVELVHPEIASQLYQARSQFYQIRPQENVPISASERTLLHRKNCQTQFESWEKFLPAKCDRVLFWGAGRSENAVDYLTIAADVFACDLVLEKNDPASVDPKLIAIGPNNFNSPGLAGAFDLVVLSNVLERLTFPKSQLTMCARLLKPGGIVVLEVPEMTYATVRASEYGPEEINFFSAESLRAIVSTEGNFNILALNEAEEPAALKNATGYWSGADEVVPSQKRPVLRMVLQNCRNQIDSPQPDIEPQDMASYLLALSRACMMHQLTLARFSDNFNSAPQAPLPTTVLDH